MSRMTAASLPTYKVYVVIVQRVLLTQQILAALVQTSTAAVQVSLYRRYFQCRLFCLRPPRLQRRQQQIVLRVQPLAPRAATMVSLRGKSRALSLDLYLGHSSCSGCYCCVAFSSEGSETRVPEEVYSISPLSGEGIPPLKWHLLHGTLIRQCLAAE